MTKFSIDISHLPAETQKWMLAEQAEQEALYQACKEWNDRVFGDLFEPDDGPVYAEKRG